MEEIVPATAVPQQVPDELYVTVMNEKLYVTNAGEAVVTIFSLSGKALLSETLSGKLYVDLSNIPDGVYIVSVYNSVVQDAAKIIIPY